MGQGFSRNAERSAGVGQESRVKSQNILLPYSTTPLSMAEVADDVAVAEDDGAFSALCDIGFVGDHDDGASFAVEPLE